MADEADGARIAAAARRWVGTPYAHRASLRGAGADCLGLVLGVWREVFGDAPTPPAYAADWQRRPGEERLWAALSRAMTPTATPEIGDALLFRLFAGGPAAHLGVMTGPARMVHAYQRRGVCDSPLCEAWRRRMVAAFRLPREDD